MVLFCHDYTNHVKMSQLSTVKITQLTVLTIPELITHPLYKGKMEKLTKKCSQHIFTHTRKC